MFKIKVHGEIGGVNITLTPSKCYEVTHIDIGGTFIFKGKFICLDGSSLMFENITDKSLEYVNYEDVRDIKEIDIKEDKVDMCLIEKRAKDVEYGIEEILELYYNIREKLNSTSAYTDKETKERIELMLERDILQRHLRMLGIQDFEIKDECIKFNII